jgi:putative ABC transport system ATP-binding protein
MARAIVTRPDALLCEEPAGAPDLETGRQALQAIAAAKEQAGSTTVAITNDSAIAGMADRVLHLKGGRIARIQTNARRLSPAKLAW